MFQGLIYSPVALVIFVMTIFTSIRALRDPMLRDRLIFNPVLVSERKEYYRLFTSGLIHGSAMHLLFNMLAFFFFAFSLERLIGHWQFGFLYIACLLVADIPTLVRQQGNIIYRTLGASGAISGVFTSIMLLKPETPVSFIFFPFIEFEMWVLGTIFILYSFLATFSGFHQRVNHDAHLWGALAGIVFTVILAPEAAENFVGFINSLF